MSGDELDPLLVGIWCVMTGRAEDQLPENVAAAIQRLTDPDLQSYNTNDWKFVMGLDR